MTADAVRAGGPGATVVSTASDMRARAGGMAERPGLAALGRRVLCGYPCGIPRLLSHGCGRPQRFRPSARSARTASVSRRRRLMPAWVAKRQRHKADHLRLLRREALAPRQLDRAVAPIRPAAERCAVRSFVGGLERIGQRTGGLGNRRVGRHEIGQAVARAGVVETLDGGVKAHPQLLRATSPGPRA
jgi:hypothetical protein